MRSEIGPVQPVRKQQHRCFDEQVLQQEPAVRAGNFGTRTKRAELSVPNDAPGPGTYDAKEPVKPEAKQTSAFASQTKRGAYSNGMPRR